MGHLTAEEVKRYQRHLVLKGFGQQAQGKLKDAKVLVVGAGGLGCPALLYLAAAGIGTIGVADHDIVDVTNLQRQILYSEADIGHSKAEIAAKKLKDLNSSIAVQSHKGQLSSANALSVLTHYDIVVDATDNFPTRYLLNDACVLLEKPLVYGSVLEFEGQVAVFNQKIDGIFSPNYRDLFPEPPLADFAPNCEEAGVLGVIPGIIGTMQAAEVIKILTGTGETLAGKLLIVNVREFEQTIINVPQRNARASIHRLIDYEDFCGISQDKNKSLVANDVIMKEVTVQELKNLKDSGEDFQLIDVREPYEYDICNLDGELIPMSEIPSNVDRISKDKKVILHCRSGKRSGDMLLWLEKNHGFKNLYNLKGGIIAWAKEVDPEMPTY